jgi:hypothetical protein
MGSSTACSSPTSVFARKRFLPQTLLQMPPLMPWHLVPLHPYATPCKRKSAAVLAGSLTAGCPLRPLVHPYAT